MAEPVNEPMVITDSFDEAQRDTSSESKQDDTLTFTESSNDATQTTAESIEIQKDKVDGAESPSTEGYCYVYKCVFCEVVLTSKDEPKILECLHNACGNCIQQKTQDLQDVSVENRELQCTVCGFYMDPANIIENQFLVADSHGNEDISKLKEVICSSCSDEVVASSWCVECAEFICDNCVQAHQRLKITKDHTIKPKEEGVHENKGNLNAGSFALYCKVHQHEKLSLFCENCDKLTCRDCQLTEHRDHKYKFTHEIAADCRKFLMVMLKDISYKKVLLNSAMKVIDERQCLIMEKKQELVQQITSLVVKLTQTINSRGKQLVARLNEVCDSKHKTLHEKKVALNHLSKITDHCIQFTGNVLENNNDNALLYTKRHLTNHLQRIKSRRADIPNPEIPVRIELALDRVNDLIKVMSGIGQIVVDGRVYPPQTPSPNNPGAMPPQSSPNSNNQHQPSQQPPQYGATNMYSKQGWMRMMPPSTAMYYPNKQPMMQTQIGQNKSGQTPLQNLSMSVQSLNSHPQTLAGPPPNSLQPQHRMMMDQQQRMQMMRAVINVGNGGQPNPNSQQQVTSSTHPQGNLRGLLQPNNGPVYIQTGPSQYQAVHRGYLPPSMTHPAGGAPSSRPPPPPPPVSYSAAMPGVRYPSGYSRFPGGVPPRAQMGGGGRWHIPQAQGNSSDAPSAAQGKASASSAVANNNFKILLKSQNSSSVSSTKSPSPGDMNADCGSRNAEKSMDKFCEESVNDLMATIAKLDSNGVQVLAENRAKTGGSPHVDSSTGDVVKVKSELMDKDDPNEDWCAVCMDGGELVCCDKCPKVFHQFCHIPNLSVEESDIWQCLLCVNFADIPDEGNHPDNELSYRQKKIAERIILELYCQYELSLPFREVVGLENVAYHAVIKNPVALDTIRQRLDWNSAECYKSLEYLVRDVRQMFRNAYLFNAVDSQVYSDAKSLEKFFDEQLEKWLPEYAYEMFEEEENVQPPKRFRRIISDEEFD